MRKTSGEVRNMNAFQWETAEEIDQQLAERVRRIRKRRKITQQELRRLSMKTNISDKYKTGPKSFTGF